ncbi:hypothetical protein M501DRAFT_1014802 [Patellaria atrata CBS 101060]|uniref:Protein kinase domain-containing protein n=1 Tax=Patellaria atrata CBS 101060 TaxID=1346257 RepID=A0A9P4SE71_9PEZI|nr:hypothetical protein M501DRAFT_1014802 [Patellaria atrata CBS 101060]
MDYWASDNSDSNVPTIPFLEKEVTYDPSEDSGERSLGTCRLGEPERIVDVVFEWRPSTRPDNLVNILEYVHDEVALENDWLRPEDVYTLPIIGILEEKDRHAIAYDWPGPLLNLHDVIRKTKIPSARVRRHLASLVANKVRSMQVHHRFNHMALRTESFVFERQFDSEVPDLKHVYVLDWGRSPSPSVYQHPKYRKNESRWYYDTWSLLMVLSEIAEWKQIDGNFQNKVELSKKRTSRKEQMIDENWTGSRTSNFFNSAFQFLELDLWTLDTLPERNIKRYYNQLCKVLDVNFLE